MLCCMPRLNGYIELAGRKGKLRIMTLISVSKRAHPLFQKADNQSVLHIEYGHDTLSKQEISRCVCASYKDQLVSYDLQEFY